MADISFAAPVGRPFLTSLRWPGMDRCRTVLNRLDRVVVLTAVGVLVGVALGGALASFISDRLVYAVAEQASATAADEVALGIASQVTAADFNLAGTVGNRDDLRSRLTPILQQIHGNGAEVLGVQLVARDGTLVYTDQSSDVGNPLPEGERTLLAPAVAGRQAWLMRAPLDGNLASLYSRVLFVAVPVERDGSIVGAYIVQQHLSALDSLGLLVWAIVATMFALTFHVVVRAAAAVCSKVPTSTPDRHVATPQAGAMYKLQSEPHLTRRELEVLRLLTTTLTYEEIATQLSVSQETVRTHVKGVLNKLGQPNRTQAVLVALKRGLLQPL